MLFQREQLEEKKAIDLKNLLIHYGLSNNGKARLKEDMILYIISFPKIAIEQFLKRQGLKRISFQNLQALGSILNSMGTLTPEQEALVKLSMQGKFLDGDDGQYQKTLFKTWRIYQYLKSAIDLLTE